MLHVGSEESPLFVWRGIAVGFERVRLFLIVVIIAPFSLPQVSRFFKMREEAIQSGLQIQVLGRSLMHIRNQSPLAAYARWRV